MLIRYTHREREREREREIRRDPARGLCAPLWPPRLVHPAGPCQGAVRPPLAPAAYCTRTRTHTRAHTQTHTRVFTHTCMHSCLSSLCLSLSLSISLCLSVSLFLSLSLSLSLPLSLTDLHTVCGVSPVTQLSTPFVLASLNYGDLFV